MWCDGFTEWEVDSTRLDYIPWSSTRVGALERRDYRAHTWRVPIRGDGILRRGRLTCCTRHKKRNIKVIELI